MSPPVFEGAQKNPGKNSFNRRLGILWGKAHYVHIYLHAGRVLPRREKVGKGGRWVFYPGFNGLNEEGGGRGEKRRKGWWWHPCVLAGVKAGA